MNKTREPRKFRANISDLELITSNNRKDSLSYGTITVCEVLHQDQSYNERFNKMLVVLKSVQHDECDQYCDLDMHVKNCIFLSKLITEAESLK